MNCPASLAAAYANLAPILGDIYARGRMPLIRQGELTTLKCVNHALPSHDKKVALERMSAEYNIPVVVDAPRLDLFTTMVAESGWCALSLVSAPAPPVPANRTGMMVPVRIYTCRICGYVELYAGDVIEPDVWSAGQK